MYNNNMQGQGWGRPMQPQMTGYPQQQQQQQQQQPGGGFLQPQQTGYPGMSQFQRPMQTSFGYQQQQQQPQGIAPQQTGMMGGGMGGMGMQQVRPQPTSNFLSPGPTGMGMGMGMGMGGGLQPQPTGYMGGLQPQQTGFMGGGGLQMQQTGLMPQMTGMPIRDPRMQLMSAQFLPASQPFSGAPVASNMNFSQASMQPSNFQSQIQNLSQQQQGSKEPRIPWALSKEERKSYDSIFRAWDAKGTGFINGEVAREVFGQSGLETEKLMQIWHLADTGNRGKLNINEFHVAMGLIYRALNGNDIPDTLPSELIPPSAKDLNDSVDFLKDLLKKDTNVRHSTGLNLPEAGSNSGTAYSKARSFHENPVAPKKDATAYKHDDADVPSYKSSSRHLDRKTVRYEGQSATDDLSEMKRQLENTQKMLDKQGGDDDEDRELEREMDDLRYRIRRVQDDIEYYNRRGGRDSADLRRKAERELMHLMHERLPQLEKRIEAKESRQRDRQLGESRERDRRNDPYSRYSSASDDRDRLRDEGRGSSRSGSNLGDGEYLRGTFDRDSDRRRDDSSSRDRYDDRDSYRRRDDDRDRDRDNGRSTPSSSSQVPPPPAAEPTKPAASPAPPAQAASSGPPKNMTAEERAAWIRSEAQRRVQERMRMLGAVAPAGPAAVDTSVEERLKAEQAEAAAKSAQADQEAAAREEARKARLEEHRLQTEKASLATVKQEIKEAEKGDNPLPAPIVQAAKEEIDDQEDMIRRREEVLAKEKAEREARLKKLEEQEEEARRQEEAFKERQSKFNSGGSATSSALPPPSRKSGKAAAPPPPPPSRSRAAPAPSAAAAPPAPTPPTTLAPPAPEAPPAPAQPSPTPSGSSSTNPFHRMQQGAGGAAAASPSTAAAPATTPGGTNPFFRSQQAQPPAADTALPPATRATPPVSAQPTGSTPKSASRAIHTAPKHDDDDWEDSDKEDDDDEADGPGSSTRATRQNLAQALFSNLIPSSGRSTPPTSVPSAPAAPPAPPAAPGAPPAPAAPAAPAAPVIKPADGPVDRGALLGQIQGGLRLKKTQTNDRSKALVTGSVIGDASPPVQKYVPPPSPPAAPEAPATSSAVAERSVDEATDVSAPPPPPPAPPAPSMPGSFDAGATAGDFAGGNPNRQSVDWANSLANDQANTKAAFIPDEPSVREEAEEDSGDDDEGPEDLDAGRKPANGHAAVEGDEVEGFDLSHTVRVRTLYGYTGQRDEDLTFEENDILSAHPAKDASSAWWYGSLVSGAKKGFFPRSYVEPIDKPAKAKALYDYAGASSEEATFSEGDELLVVDQEDANWWRVDVGGPKILVAPATYLELSARGQPTKISEGKNAEAPAASSSLLHEDSDGGSGVMVWLQSQDSAPEGLNKHVPKSADWIMVDEETRSLGSSTVNVQAPSPHAADVEAAAAEEAQLAAALEASQKDQREREVDRMREDRQMQKAIEASKMEAVAYALGSMEGAGADGNTSAGLTAGAAVTEADETEDSDSTTGWTSSEDDDDDDEQDGVAAEEDVTPHTDAEIRQHTIERLRVLEAAGVLVKTDESSADPTPNEPNDGSRDRSQDVGDSESKPVRRPPPPPGQKRHKNIDELMMLSRSRTSKRPPKPEEPQRRKPPHRPRKKPSRDLPPVPLGADTSSTSTGIADQPVTAPEHRMEDAYDRYLKMTKEVSLQPILPATAGGAAAAKNAAIPPSSPPPFATGSPARPSSAAGESSSRTSGFLSTIKSMSHRSAWTGSSGPSPRPDSGIGSRIVSGPIAMGSNTAGSLLQPASISESQRASGESSSDSTEVAATAARAGAPSWSSLVGPELLSGLSDTERKRQEAIFELISTETAHVRDLQIIVEVFFNSMQSMLSEKASTVIFANIESVLFAAVTYLSDLEARQKEDRLFVTTIGDVLERHMPAMSVYLPYCVNQQSASEILEAERKRDTRVDIHLLNLRSNHPAARGLDLSHFLLVPMQRLTRYPLLLGQILRYTPEDHVDHARIQAAKTTAENILAKTNEAIREHEDAAALAKLSENLWLGEEARLDLTKPFVDPAQPGVKRHRRVLRDELVSKSKSGRKLRLVLTTDLLLVLHAQDSSLYRLPIPVHEVKAQEAKSKSARHADAFNVVHSMPSVGGTATQADTLKLRAASARNAQVWIRVINAARADAPSAKA